MNDALEEEVGRHCILLDFLFPVVCGRCCHQCELLGLDALGAFLVVDVALG